MIILCLFVLFAVCCAENNPYAPHNPLKSDLFEPCPKLTENCIRSFFRTYSTCTPVYTDAPEVLYDMNNVRFPIPSSNVTFMWDEPPKIKGLNDGKITTFYVNRKTQHIVLEVEFNELTFYSRGSLKYYFKGREPVLESGFIEITHRKLSLTATIETDAFSGIKWEKKEVYCYFGDPVFPVVADKSLCGTDPEVEAVCEFWKHNVILNAKESGLKNGPYFFENFFEGRICKFQ